MLRAGGNWASGFISNQAAKASAALEKAGIRLQEQITPNEQPTNVGSVCTESTLPSCLCRSAVDSSDPPRAAPAVNAHGDILKLAVFLSKDAC